MQLIRLNLPIPGLSTTRHLLGVALMGAATRLDPSLTIDKTHEEITDAQGAVSENVHALKDTVTDTAVDAKDTVTDASREAMPEVSMEEGQVKPWPETAPEPEPAHQSDQHSDQHEHGDHESDHQPDPFTPSY